MVVLPNEYEAQPNPNATEEPVYSPHPSVLAPVTQQSKLKLDKDKKKGYP